MKLPLLIVLVLIIPLFSFMIGCKPHDQTPPSFEISKEVLKYLNFDVGTWWLYDKLNSDINDTVRVISKDTNELFYNGNPKVAHTEIVILLSSSEFINDTFLLYAASNSSSLIFGRYENGPSTFHDYTYVIDLGMIPFAKGASAGNTTIDSVYEIYDTGSETFNNVLRSRCTKNEVYYGGESNYYFNEKGIIRKEFIDKNDVYVLIDYFIND